MISMSELIPSDRHLRMVSAIVGRSEDRSRRIPVSPVCSEPAAEPAAGRAGRSAWVSPPVVEEVPGLVAALSAVRAEGPNTAVV